MEDYITEKEFRELKKEVDELKNNMHEIEKLFQAIDKKIDVISEKILNSDDKTQLKLQPIEKRVSDLEDSQKWLIRAIIAEVIGILAMVIFK